MKGRWGLQAKMTAGYVGVTAGAVLVTELAILGAAALSPAKPVSPQVVRADAEAAAAGLASKLAVTVASEGRMPSMDLGTPGVPVTPGRAQLDGSGGVAIPQLGTPVCDLAGASFDIVVSGAGRVAATSYPACYPSGSQATARRAGVLAKVLRSAAQPTAGSGLAAGPSGTVAWVVAPVTLAPGKTFGIVYLQVPAAGLAPGGVSVSPSLIGTGLVVLAGAVPVGLAFGLLSTRRLTRRLRRLAASTLEVADGGFERRITVSGTDELSQVEDNFNRMAGRLQASLDAGRQLAEANARHAERSRIARELHDSISQELFSLSVLAGGLRRALPAGSQMLPQVETMERTAGDTMREMQSLLLALRPVALDELGLASAVEGICAAYRERLGADVRCELDSVALPPALEHAILRVSQEALANAVRHAGASTIGVRLRAGPDRVLLEVADDGHGFDTAGPSGSGLGLMAMRDRVAEQGGQLAVDSTQAGTVVRASFPRRSR